MDYGVKFDILINGAAASKQFTAFADTIARTTPKIVKDLKLINTQMDATIRRAQRLVTITRQLRNVKIGIDTKSASAKVDTLNRKVLNLQRNAGKSTAALGIGGIVGGGTGKTTGVTGARGVGRVPSVGANLSGLRKSIFPNALFAGIGTPLAAMGLTAILTGGVSHLVRESARFEDISTNVRNILRSTDKDAATFEERFQSVAKTARQVGIDTKFTTTEVASAMKYLAMAGQDLETIEKSLKPIANLAALGDTPIDRVADLITNIMAGLRIAPESVESTADVITSTVTSTNTNVTELAEAFKFSAGIMNLAGTEFQEGAAAIGVLANAGLKGTLAGTGLRALLTRLIKPTATATATLERLGVAVTEVGENGQQRIRPLVDIFEDFQRKGATVQDIYKIFDRIAGTPAVNLLQNTDTLRTLVDFYRNSGGSSEFLAEEKMKTVIGLTDQIRSKFEELGLQAYQTAEPFILNLLNQINNFLGSNEAAGLFQRISSFLQTVVTTVVDFTGFIYRNWEYLKWLFGGLFAFSKINSLLTGILNFFIQLKVPIAAAAASSQAFTASIIGLKAVAAIGGISLLATVFAGLALDAWSASRAADQLYARLEDSEIEFGSLKKLNSQLDETINKASAARKRLDELLNPEDEALEAAPARAGFWYRWNDNINQLIARGIGAINPEAGANFLENERRKLENRGVYDEYKNIIPKNAAKDAVEDTLRNLRMQYFGAESGEERKRIGEQIEAIRNNALSAAETADQFSPWARDGRTKDVTASSQYQRGVANLADNMLDVVKAYSDVSVGGSAQGIANFYHQLGLIGAPSIDALRNEFTGELDRGAVYALKTGLSKAGFSEDRILRDFAALGIDSALKTQINKVPADFYPRINNDLDGDGGGDIDAFLKSAGKGSRSGAGTSGAGRLSGGSSGRTITVNIHNLLNIESAQFPAQLEDIKEQMAAVLVDVVKDFETGL